MAVNERVEGLLKPTGLPLAYREFKPYKGKPVPAPPYLIYFIERENARGSDDKNFYKKLQVVVELYTAAKSPTLEESVENAIQEFEFDKYEEYLDSEGMFFVSWEFDIYEKIRRQ